MVTLHRGTSTVRAWFTLAVIVCLLVALVSGIAFVLATSLGAGRHDPARTSRVSPTPAATPTTAPTVAAQDALAARAMPALPASAARPQPLADIGPEAIRLPRPMSTEGVVPTGFPPTPLGALAQLAAIDTVALRDLTPPQVESTYRWAALPGAVPIGEWTPYLAATAALDASGVPNGSADLRSTFTPVAGQVKGTIGAHFAVVCVLGEWQVTYRTTSRAGAGDCQRMVWDDGRWRIGAGAQPAFAPSAWPGSVDAVQAGWRGLSDA